MSRSTLIMVVVFGALVAVWAVSQFSGGPGDVKQLPPLKIDGFLKKEISLQDIKILNKDEDSPYTKFTVTKKGKKGPETYVISLDPATAKEKKASDRKWRVTRTFDGGKRTMKTKAENYRLRIYNQALARSFRSSYSFEANDKDLPQYGLDADHAITLIAESPDQTVKLRIGGKHKIDDETPATWVMNPDVKGVVYQISGHDLRAHFDADWKDIRDRKILSINPGRIHRVELTNPRGHHKGKVVLERAKLTQEQLAKLAKAKKWDEVRKADADWKIVAPAGFTADGQEIGGWLESLERMSATDYVDIEGGKLPEGTGLDAADKAVQVTLHDGDKVVKLRLGGLVPKAQEKDIYLQVEGNQDEIYTVAGWMGDQVVMDLGKVRYRKLMGADKAADAVKVTTLSQGETFTATKGAQGWTSSASIDPKNVTDFLGDLDGVRVEWRAGTTREAAGLVKPKSQVTLTWADGHTRTLSVAAKSGDDDLAAWDKGDVFKLPSWNAGRLHRRPRDFADKHVAPVKAADISEVVVPGEKPGEKVTLTREGGGWKASNGAALKPKVLDQMLDQFVRSEYHAEEDVKPADVGLAPPAWEITVKTTDGKRYGLRLSDKRKDNNPYGQMVEQGKPGRLFTISAMMVQVIRKTMKDLKK